MTEGELIRAVWEEPPPPRQRRRRARLNWSQTPIGRYLLATNGTTTEFAKLAGVSLEAARKWANGERSPSRRTMRRIEKATGGKLRPIDFFPTSPGAA
jgi:transcriptional regulator with XRE-family HTH domain